MGTGECADKLKGIIEKAMEDLEITSAEYDEVLSTACEDGFEDDQEKALLREFQAMIGDGTIKRVPG